MDATWFVVRAESLPVAETGGGMKEEVLLLDLMTNENSFNT
jgi:hypothetical protein